jgi:hypothetical protein
MPLIGRPVVEMFWVAEYTNGQALSQYDPFLNKENSYAEVDHKNVLRFWWLPITPKMTRQFPGTRYNPCLVRHAVEVKGSKGFVARRVNVKLATGGNGGKPIIHKIKCYVLGIEGGPRREIYPDGRVISKLEPDKGESQDLLHHG